jgi:hypothetical protein
MGFPPMLTPIYAVPAMPWHWSHTAPALQITGR